MNLLFPKPRYKREREARREKTRESRFAFRLAVLKADGYKCANPECPRDWRTSKQLEPHHIKYRSEGGLDKVENGVTLCRSDHWRAHHGHDGLTGRQFVLRILEAIDRPGRQFTDAITHLRRKIK